jgi:hypothetical protein
MDRAAVINDRGLQLPRRPKRNLRQIADAKIIGQRELARDSPPHAGVREPLEFVPALGGKALQSVGVA